MAFRESTVGTVIVATRQGRLNSDAMGSLGVPTTIDYFRKAAVFKTDDLWRRLVDSLSVTPGEQADFGYHRLPEFVFRVRGLDERTLIVTTPAALVPRAA